MNKTLKFSPELVPLVLSGEKDSTWRLWDDKDLKEGDVITLIKRPELVPFATAELVSVVEKPIGQMTEEDKMGHEKFASDEEMYKIYTGYYKRTVDLETPIKIVRFKLIKKL